LTCYGSCKTPKACWRAASSLRSTLTFCSGRHNPLPVSEIKKTPFLESFSVRARGFASSPDGETCASLKQKTLFRGSFVGARGFEPPTSCTPCKRASRAAPRPDDLSLPYPISISQPSSPTLALQAPHTSRAAPRPEWRLAGNIIVAFEYSCNRMTFTPDYATIQKISWNLQLLELLCLR
jgi:hypothetical protein